MEFGPVGPALLGRRGKRQQRIARVGLEVVGTLLRKNHDYGSAVFEPPLLCPRLSAQEGILVRMSDKLRRLTALAGKEEQAEVAESLDDTLKDLAGYAILLLVARREKNEEERTD